MTKRLFFLSTFFVFFLLPPSGHTANAFQAVPDTIVPADKAKAPAPAEPVRRKVGERKFQIKVTISHAALDTLLQQHVDANGKVDYKGLLANKKALDAYCLSLSGQPVQENWSREEKMVYWINAYNAFTLKLIVDNYPVKSILDLDGGKTWDVKRIRIGSQKYSLNNIENDILRPQFQDPRIHFAINCAAKSCPPLWSRAYTIDNLESSLETRARAFINNPTYNTITASKARVSKIFDWYGADFGDLKKYLNRYLDKQLSAKATVEFLEYDWKLN